MRAAKSYPTYEAFALDHARQLRGQPEQCYLGFIAELALSLGLTLITVAILIEFINLVLAGGAAIVGWLA